MKRKKTDKPDGRCATCPRWDRWHIRIPKSEDQERLRQRSLLNESFKVITEDKSAEPYLRELNSIIALMRRIGILYNEAVKTLNLTLSPQHKE